MTVPKMRKMMKGLAFAAIVGLANGLSRIKIDPKTRRYVDDDDRSMTFHGMNAVYKKFP